MVRTNSEICGQEICGGARPANPLILKFQYVVNDYVKEIIVRINIRVCKGLYRENGVTRYRQILAVAVDQKFVVEEYEGVVESFDPFKAKRSDGYPVGIECESEKAAYDRAGKEHEDSLTRGWQEYGSLAYF